jgi:threonine synthase
VGHTNWNSTFKQLECSNCARSFETPGVHTYCPECRLPLLAVYDMDKARSQVDRDEIYGRGRGMWRWHDLLPLSDPSNLVTLGEGDTPILRLDRLGAQLGLKQLYLKDESINPTGSFKARGMASAISKAKELGLQNIVLPTAGNAGGALAAYASRAGMRSFIIAPEDTPSANIQEARIAGAEVKLVPGLISDAARLAGEMAAEGLYFDLSTFKEPYRLEGKKVMGYEIAEAFDWQLPDVIVYPTGGGTGLVGIWKAVQELLVLGWVMGSTLPRMIVVQAAGCAPVVKAFEDGTDDCAFWNDAHTIASGLRVPRSFASRLIMKVLKESSGTALSVSDSDMMAAQQRLAVTEGVFAAPEGAATLAGLEQLQQRGLVHPDERIVLLNTASGLKYLNLFMS